MSASCRRAGTRRATSTRRATATAPITFPTIADANAWLSTTETAIARGAWIDPRSSAITFESYADSWLESRPGLRPRTVELYRSLLDRHLVPAFGDHELGKLTAPSVRRWYARLLRDADQRTVTLAKCYRLLRAILNTAVGDELIVRNPCTIKGAGIERSPERPVATIAQVWTLAGSVDPRFRCFVLTAAFAGLRFGELATLTRARIDLPGAHDRRRREPDRALRRHAADRSSEVGRRPAHDRHPRCARPGVDGALGDVRRARRRRSRLHRRQGSTDATTELVG